MVPKVIPWNVKRIKPRKDFTLIVDFEDGNRRQYDFKPMLKYDINAKLRNIGFFMTAHEAGGGVVWDDEHDIDPEELYYNGVPISK